MKRFLCGVLMTSALMSIHAEKISIAGNDYEYTRIIERKIGPGTTYLRIRIPDYPLNVNMVLVDLNNPYNRIETTIANESAKGTESLVNAARRLDYGSHHPLAAANANFWVVGSQNEYPLYAGITRNASVRNGKIVTESNQFKEKWDGGTQRTGVVAISYDKTLYIDYCSSSITVRKSIGSPLEITQCNKGVRNDEIAMYNSYFGSDRQFMPYTVVDKKYTFDDTANCYELYLNIDEGEKWTGGEPITFTVAKGIPKTSGGKLEDFDLALVAKKDARPSINKLVPGEKIELKYTWTFEGDRTPLVEQAIGGNAMVMRGGELTEHNYNEDYNSQIYSRTGYGASADGKTLYMLVIDKSTDPVYGKSAGCSTATMSEIARHFGCSNLSNFDAGGSAEMMVDFRIVNKTTETNPRDVANGWMVFSVAPDDDHTINSIEFDHPEIDIPLNGSFSPTVLAYDKYDNLVDKNLQGFTLSCDPALGSCSGMQLNAAANPASGILTASYGNVSVSKKISVGSGSSSVDEKQLWELGFSCPGKIGIGEDFFVKCNIGIESINIINQNGIIMSSVKSPDADTAMRAPTVPGLYLIAARLASGRNIVKKVLVI